MEAATAASALEVLRGMCRQSEEAPEAFCAEYAATTARAVELLARSEGDALLVGAGGETCLHYAAGCGCLEACSSLLGRRGALNFQQDALGQTPLFWAARRGMVQTAQLLLAHGADPDHADRQGLTPLRLARRLGLPRLCRALRAHGGPDGGGRGAPPRAAAAASPEAARPEPEQHAARLRPAAAPRRQAWALPRTAAAASCPAAALEAEDALHGCLAEAWAHRLDYAGPAARLLEAGSWLDIDPPELEHVSAESVGVSCVIADLEYRLVEYVLEVRRCDGAPRGGAPLRVYYARTGAQRKVDDVLFEVPRRRPAGVPVWEPGGVYQFRLTGRCCRREMAYLHHPNHSRLVPQQVASEWSRPAPLLPARPRRARRDGRTPSKVGERACRRGTARPASWEPP